MKKIYILGAIVCGLASCKPNIEPKAPERGDVDLSRYMAVGSSHTAGIMDGALYKDGQLNSYPLILSEQFKAVGGGQFKQPMSEGQHGWPVGKKILANIQGICDTVSRVGIRFFNGALDTAGTGQNIYSMGPFGNMGVAGSKITDYLVPGFGMQNRFAYRMFNKPATARMLEELQNPGHTFFTSWAGIDDVMDYATGGGERPGAPSSYRGRITDPFTFEFAYDSLLTVLTRNGAKGVLLNIPELLTMPYFRAMSPNGLELNMAQANKLNLQYNGTQVHFDIGMNYYVIEDKKMKDGFRQINEGEIVRMDIPADSIRCYGWGASTPIPEEWVLTADEIVKIETAIETYNGIILKLANAYKLPVSDVKYFLKTIAQDGGKFNGVNFNYDIMSTSLYSLDGIHFTGRGNAMLANWIINTINAHYKSSIHDADVTKYSGIRRP